MNMNEESFYYILGVILSIGIAIVLVILVFFLFLSLKEYLVFIWQEKHKPRRQTLTYEDIVKILSLEISCLPFDHVLFGNYRTAIGHFKKIADFYERNSKDGRLPKIIEKHIEPCFFNDLQQGAKTFEIRKDKDDIQPGDILVLREMGDYGETGNVLYYRVKGVFRDGQKYGLRCGYCIISI